MNINDFKHPQIPILPNHANAIKKSANPQSLQPKSELNTPLNIPLPTNSNVIPVQLLDAYIGNSVYEGAPSSAVMEHFVSVLESIQKDSKEETLTDILPLFKECLNVDKQIIKIRNDTNSQALTKKLAESLMEQAQALKVGQQMLLPGGWYDAYNTGHAMLYCIERDSPTTFKFLIFNAGLGLNYHVGYTDKKSQSHYQGFIEIKDIPLENLSKTIFQGMIELFTLSKFQTERNLEKKIYSNLVAALGGKLNASLEPKNNPYIYSKPQRSGTCSFKSRLYALRYLILKKEIQYPVQAQSNLKIEKQKELYQIYKKIRFAHKKKVLIQLSEDFLKPNTPYSIETKRIISKSLKNISRMAEKLAKQKLLSEKDLDHTFETFDEIRNQIAKKKTKHLAEIKSKDIEISYKLEKKSYPSDLIRSEVKLIKDESEIDDEVKSVTSEDSESDTEVIEEDPYEAEFNTYENIIKFIPQPPKVLTSENVSSFLQSWSKIDFVHLKKCLNDISIVQQVTFALQTLPIPKNNDKDDFWKKVPQTEIESCLESLNILTSVYTGISQKKITINDISWSSNVEVNAALAIADALARREPEYQLDGYHTPYFQIERFATNPGTIITNPLVQQRLKDTLLYFDPTVDTSGVSHEYNNRHDLLFVLSDASFMMYSYEIEHNSEFQLYGKFVDKVDNARRFVKKNIHSLQDKIVYIATKANKSNNILPKGLLNLRNIAFRAQIVDPTHERNIKPPKFDEFYTYFKYEDLIDKKPVIALAQKSNRKNDPQSYTQFISFKDEKFEDKKSDEYRRHFNIDKLTDNDSIENLKQNKIMGSYLEESKRDFYIRSLNTHDEIVRYFSYLQSKPDNDFEPNERLNFIIHFFGQDRLLRQLEKEPRIAKKIMQYLNDQIQYNLKAISRIKKDKIRDEDWKNLLFFVEMAKRCSDFIESIKDRNPNHFKGIDIPIWDYSKWLTEEIIPKIISKPNLLVNVYQTIFKLNSSTQKPLTNEQLDFLCATYMKELYYNSKIDGSYTQFDPIGSSRLALEQELKLKQFNQQFDWVLKNDNTRRTAILNGVIKTVKNKNITEPWTGNYPIYKSGIYTVNVDDVSIVEDGEEITCKFPDVLDCEDIEAIFGNINKTTRVVDPSDSSKTFYYIDATFGKFEVCVKGKKPIAIYHFINNQKYQLNEEPFDFSTTQFFDFQAKTISWKIITKTGHEILYTFEDKIVFYLDGDNKNNILSISDTSDRKRHLASPEQNKNLSSLFQHFITDLTEIKFWALNKSPEKLNAIEIPGMNLNFIVKKGTDGKERLYSQQYQGYFISGNQHPELSELCPYYLILENENSEKKAIVCEFKEKSATKHSFEPVKSFSKEPEIYVFDIKNSNRKIELKSKNTKEALFLANMYILRRNYKKALKVFENCYSVSYFENGEHKIINIIVEENKNKNPEAVLCRLKAWSLFLQNSKKYDDIHGFNKNLRRPISNLTEDYQSYITNLQNTPKNILSLYEEKLLINVIAENTIDINYVIKARLNLINDKTEKESTKEIERFKIGKLNLYGLSIEDLLYLLEYSSTQKNDIEDYLFETSNIVNTKKWNPKSLQSLYLCIEQNKIKNKNEFKQNLILALSDDERHTNKSWLTFFLALIDLKEFPVDLHLYNLKRIYNEGIQKSPPGAQKIKDLLKDLNEIIKSSTCINTLISGLDISFFYCEPDEVEMEKNLPIKSDYISTPKDLTKIEQDWNDFFIDLKKRFEINPEVLKRLITDAITHANAKISTEEMAIESAANQFKTNATPLEKLKHLGKTTSNLSVDDVVTLFENGDLALYALKTSLDKEQIIQLDQRVGELMVYTTRLAQLKRIADLLKEESDTDEKELLRNKILNELGTTRAYFLNPEQSGSLRKQLVFEYRNNLLLRLKQQRTFTTLQAHVDTDPFSLELGTGSGKSKVIAPLLQKIRRAFGKLILNIWPSALYQVNKMDMQSQVVNSFKQRADTFEFTRDTSMSVENLTFILDELNIAIAEERQINTTTESLQSLELKFHELLNSELDYTKEINLLQTILDIINSSEAHIDESHINLSPKREVNFTIGNPDFEPHENIEFIGKIFDFLTTGQVGKILNIAEDKQRFVTKERFDEEIVPKLIEQMAIELKIDDTKAFTEYVLGGPITIWVENHPKKHLIALLRGHVNSLLFTFFQNSVNVNFGFTHKGYFSRHAIPYYGNDCPNEKADYELIYEAIDKTYLTYLHQGLNKYDLWELVKTLQTESIRQSKQTVPPTPLNQTEAVQFFDKNFPNIGSIFSISRSDLGIESLKKNRELILRYVTKIIAPNIRKFNQQLKSSSQNTRSIIKKIIAMSATPGNPYSYAPKVKCELDPNASENVKNQIRKKCASSSSIHITKSSNPRNILTEMLPKLKNDFRMLIDIGALFKGINNGEMAKNLLESIKKTNPQIRGVVYFDDSDSLVILEEGKEKAIPLEQSSLSLKERFTYCDQRHTFGADIRQFSSAKGLATFDTLNTMEEVFQGVGRLRQFMEGQSVEWLVTSDATNLILKGEKRTLKIDDLLKRADENQVEQNENILFASIRHQLQNEVRSTLNQLLVKSTPLYCNTNNSPMTKQLWNEFKQFLITNSVDSPFLLFGQNNDKQHAADILLAYRKELSSQITEYKLIPQANKDELLAKLLTYDKHIQMLRNQLPKEVSTHSAQLGTSTESQQQTQTQNNTQNQTQNETQNMNQLQNVAKLKELEPTQWPEDVNFYDSEWLIPTDVNAKVDLIRIEENPYYNTSKTLFKKRIKKIALTAGVTSLLFATSTGLITAALIAAKIAGIAIPIFSAFPPLLVGLFASVCVVTAVAAIYGLVTLVQAFVKSRRGFVRIRENGSFLEYKKMPLYKLEDILSSNKELKKLIPDALFSKIQPTDILVTNNFVTRLPEIMTRPLTEEQKSLYELLIIRDEIEGKVQWKLIIGDQYTDATVWRKMLEDITHEEAKKHRRKVCLYDLVSGIAQDSPNQMDEEEINNDEKLQLLLTIVKLYNGDVNYAPKQINIINAMDNKQMESINTFAKRARLWHDEKQKQYHNSNFAEVIERKIS